MTGRMRWAAVLLAGTLAACSQPGPAERSGFAVASGAASAPAGDGSGAADNFLAYEHSAVIQLAAAEIPARVREAQAACGEGRFGQCVVLNVQQEGGDSPQATLGMRIVPAGVEPMLAQASKGSEIGSRSTRAEDLAVVVRDSDMAQARLRSERERLQEFQARRDLAVADMIALSRQLAEVESQLEAAEQQGAQHRRRIDTQLLTLHFRPTAAQESGNEVLKALKESGSILAHGIAWTIRALAFLLPLLVLVTVAVVMVRRWRRRRRT